MKFSEEIKNSLKELSLLVRQVYGIREKESVSFREHPAFVKEVIEDFTNISQNLAIADQMVSDSESELFKLAMEKIFYAHGKINQKFIQSIDHKLKTYANEEPRIKSPILMLERAKIFDQKSNTELESRIRALLVEYAEAMVMSDGIETVGEFDVLETFKTWVNGEG